MKQYIVISSQSDAKVYEEDTRKRDLRLLKTFRNPQGRAHKRAFFSDNRAAQKITTNAHGMAKGHYKLATNIDPRVIATKKFVIRVCTALKKSIQVVEARNIVFAASPQLLGLYRKQMRHLSLQNPLCWINKDLIKLTAPELKKYLNKRDDWPEPAFLGSYRRYEPKNKNNVKSAIFRARNPKKIQRMVKAGQFSKNTPGNPLSGRVNLT